MGANEIEIELLPPLLLPYNSLPRITGTTSGKFKINLNLVRPPTILQILGIISILLSLFPLKLYDEMMIKMLIQKIQFILMNLP